MEKLSKGKRNSKASNSSIAIEFLEYNGADKEERIKMGLDLLVEFLAKEYMAKNNLTSPKDIVNGINSINEEAEKC